MLKPMSYRTLGFPSTYGMTNESNIRVAFTAESTPKRGRKG